MEETVKTERSTFEFTLECRIENFPETSEVFQQGILKFASDSIYIDIFVLVFPNGADESDKGWLVVHPTTDVFDDLYDLLAHVSLCTVSIIDNEGNCRFPKYFEMRSYNIGAEKAADFRGAKYLEKSLILERKDELISDGVLVLRCDIRIDLDVEKKEESTSYEEFLCSFHMSVIINEGAEPGEPSDRIKVHDFTSQILTLPQFHESRKRFGVYDIPPDTSTVTSRADNKDSLEDIWIIDTDRKRFLLSFSQRPDSVGRLLLGASPVFERCINTPMKEQKEKRIDLSHVSGKAFLRVLHFLERGELETDFRNFCVLMGIYEFSHLYIMGILQQNCAKRLVESATNESEVEEIKAIANLCEDENLSNLLESRLRKLATLDLTSTDVRTNLDCYI